MGAAKTQSAWGAHKYRLLKWAVMVLLVVMYFTFGSVDRQMKHAPHEGYYPEGAESLVFFPAFPEFWGAFLDSHAGTVLTEELSDVAYNVQLAVRHATGIRPTPARWQLWLGPQALVALYEDAWGVCFHPGLLAQWAIQAHQLFYPEQDAAGIYRFGDLYYARMDGFLVLSLDKAYVEAVRRNPRTSETNIVAFDSLAYQRISPDTALSLELQAGPDLFLRGYLNDDAFSGDRQRLATLDLPATEVAPMITFGATAWEDCVTVWEHIKAPLIHSKQDWAPDWTALQAFLEPVTALAFPAIQERLEAAPHGPVYWVLADVDTSEPLPTPIGAMLMENAGDTGAQTLFQLLSEQAPSIPYFWGIYEGAQYPIWGEKLTFCVTTDENFSYLTTQEPLLYQLAGNTQPGRHVRGNLLLDINWTAIGATLQRHRLRHNQQRTPAAATDAWLSAPRLDAYNAILQRLGALELVGETRDGMLEFRGYLARDVMG